VLISTDRSENRCLEQDVGAAVGAEVSIEAECPKLMSEARRAGGGVGEGWQGYVGERSGRRARDEESEVQISSPRHGYMPVVDLRRRTEKTMVMATTTSIKTTQR
jgi:hypothetical protein